jgi:AcrR family transcriptional regulator
MAAPARIRKSAEERREEIVAVAIEHFGRTGYHGTSTEAIARAAGISQPYLFRLFGTKKDLFLACEDRHHDFLEAVFRRAAEAAPPGERLQSMGKAYVEQLLPDRHALRFQMQSYAACADSDIRAYVRRRYGELVRVVADLGDVTVSEVWSFFATGMLLNVVATLELETIADSDDWARAWTTPDELIDLSGA